MLEAFYCNFSQVEASIDFFVYVQACRHGHVQHLEHLLFYGADMGAQNASGNAALHICALYNQVSRGRLHMLTVHELELY